MKTSRTLLSIALLLAAVGCGTGTKVEGPSIEKAGYALTGYVPDNTLDLDNARAIAIRDNGETYRAFLDRRGNFELELPKGTYRIVIGNARSADEIAALGRLVVSGSEWIEVSHAIDFGAVVPAGSTMTSSSSLSTRTRSATGDCGSDCTSGDKDEEERESAEKDDADREHYRCKRDDKEKERICSDDAEEGVELEAEKAGECGCGKAEKPKRERKAKTCVKKKRSAEHEGDCDGAGDCAKSDSDDDDDDDAKSADEHESGDRDSRDGEGAKSGGDCSDCPPVPSRCMTRDDCDSDECCVAGFCLPKLK